MADVDTDRLIFIVTGVDLTAELGDRPLAYRVEQEVRRLLDQLLPAPATDAPRGPPVLAPAVVSDVYFLNHDQDVQDRPTISIGGPGVNALSGLLVEKLPTAVAIEKTLVVQMDLDMAVNKCCVWGMTHLDTVRAVELFMAKGYLETFVRAVAQAVG